MDDELLENKLDDFDKGTRLEALHLLKEKADADQTSPLKKTDFINLHCHTFFSFNAFGYSPSHIAWRAFKEGLEVVGIVDFDVLDGVEEILEAGEILGLKTVAGIETRVFIKEYSDKVINSPKEPGVFYFMGTGFYKRLVSGSGSDETLARLTRIARDRNLAMLERINNFLRDVQIVYETDVLPLTPGGNATERHILVALDNKAKEIFDNSEALITFWAEKLGVEREKIASVLNSPPELQGLIRSKLMKSGGIGYVKPEKGSFPALEEMIEMIKDCDALPTAAWLDGTNEGEGEPKELFRFLIEKGSVLLNIIPDRNWNIKDAEEKKIKVRNLDEVIKVAQELNLPIVVGTEMNKYGQKFVDDFTVPELAAHLDYFRQGAFFVYGHTRMAKSLNKGYHSDWAKRYLPERGNRNRFYTEVGQSVEPGYDYENLKRTSDDHVQPDEILRLIKGG
jgi:hypothetical protein